MESADPSRHRLSPSPLARAAWLALALLCLGLGIIGIVLPGLPTTPFILLAAFAAARGSRRLHDWLRGHRLFGPMVADWEREGAVSLRAKRVATLTMVLCGVILFIVSPRWWMAAIGCVFMTIVALWLWTRPSPAERPRAPVPGSPA